jgi:hypothetical protein
VIGVNATKPHHGVAYRPFWGGWEGKPKIFAFFFLFAGDGREAI